MKCRIFLTTFLSLSFLLTVSQPTHSGIFAGRFPITPADPAIGSSPRHSFPAYCIDAYTLRELPCPYQVSIEGVPCRTSDGPATNLCGHLDAFHTPTSRNDLTESRKVAVLGGLTDAWQQTPKTGLPVRTMPPQNPRYSFTYHAGEVSGEVHLKAVAVSPPDGYYFIAPCESRESCTILRIMAVGLTGLEELRAPLPLPPPPPWPPEEVPAPETWDGYVRCGRTALCPEPVSDNPYNWPAHPQVHWGKFEFLNNLILLGRLWYANCCQPLVISDISLPDGGLLDIGDNWQTPHSLHRYGISADISNKSVPGNPSLQCDCGPKPTGTTLDPVWEKTMLRKFADEYQLAPLNNDPGHLKPVRKEK